MKWEVVEYAMTENYTTDRTVEPRVLSRHRFHWFAERASYRENRVRAIYGTREAWRATRVDVRQAL